MSWDYKEEAKKVVRFGKDSEAPDRDLYKIGIPLDGIRMSAWMPGRDWTDDDIEFLLGRIEIHLTEAVSDALGIIAIDDKELGRRLQEEQDRGWADLEKER